VPQPLVHPAMIRAMAGSAVFARGSACHVDGAVESTHWDEATRVLTGVVRGSERSLYRCTVRLAAPGAGRPIISARCTCPMQADCAHTVATLLEANGVMTGMPPSAVVTGDPSTRSAARPSPTWRNLLDPPPAGVDRPLALGVELRQREAYRSTEWAPRKVTAAEPRSLARRQDDLVLAIRPLVRSDSTGAWIKGDASWDAVRRPSAPFRRAHARWFAELSALALGARAFGPFSDPGEWLTLDTVDSGLLWPHLASAAGLGIPLTATSRHQTIALASQPATAVLEVAGDGDGLRLHARVDMGDERVENAVIRAVGSSGIYVAELDRDPIPVLLAPCALSDAARTVLAVPDGLPVPAAEAEEFLEAALPRLARRERVIAAPGIPLPRTAEPTAVVTTAFTDDDVVDYRIEWAYPGLSRLTYPAATHPDRDDASEARIRAAIESTWAGATDLPFASSARLSGADAAEFGARVLPVWQTLAHVRIEGSAPRRAYTELSGRPEIRITTAQTTDSDWFDLGVVVTIDGRSIPFSPLFAALSLGRRRLLLSDGAYFSLAHPSLDRLKELIEEAGELSEWESGPRISRHQVALWADFEDLADEAAPAVAWRELVAGLRDVDEVPPTPTPPGLRAQLRPYQRAGFSWLAFLWRHRLGGVLADDMGLGKTVQLLGLVAHAREAGERRPVLVVAPTSVLGTWAAEAARFAPELDVRVVDTTSARRGDDVAAIARDAHLVVTSYTLLRLDAGDFAACDWAFVVLDEAQFAKNPATKLYRAITALRADAVYAATGTPLENSLADLWALLSLTAPGLFPSGRRFREEYVKPIEQGKVPDNEEGGPFRAARLDRLRRRIRPLLLRRTKESVAPELPPRQEQELRIALDPAHRALYERVLQRERQKVLGLLDDLDRNRFIVFRSLTLLRMMSLAPALVDPEHGHIASSKLDALVERMVEVAAEGHRILVFSQFTSFLRLAGERLDAAGIGYAYLDGSTRRRAAVIDAFRAGDDPAFLISLKAGGFGLTLTEADYVFVLDPWWNPAAEAQAVDRAHRIGQTRTVFVYRLIAADTIEEKVLALQRRKARLFQAVVDDDELFTGDLTADDIRALLER
jgi:superfamily II DNA or RNA helicase